MVRLHLVAIVPNEDARRLAAWILRTNGATIATVATAAGITATMVARILSGEVVPASDLAHALWLATDGDIARQDWRTSPAGGWFDAVTPQMARAA